MSASDLSGRSAAVSGGGICWNPITSRHLLDLRKIYWVRIGLNRVESNSQVRSGDFPGTESQHKQASGWNPNGSGGMRRNASRNPTNSSALDLRRKLHKLSSFASQNRFGVRENAEKTEELLVETIVPKITILSIMTPGEDHGFSREPPGGRGGPRCWKMAAGTALFRSLQTVRSNVMSGSLLVRNAGRRIGRMDWD